MCIKLQEEVQFTHAVVILGLSFPCSQTEEKNRGKEILALFLPSVQFKLLCLLISANRRSVYSNRLTDRKGKNAKANAQNQD